MGELGTYLQKCMYPVGLTPFVALSVEELIRSRREEETTLTFVIGSHGDQIRSYFGAEYRGVRVNYREQPTVTGTAEAALIGASNDAAETTNIIWLADTFVSASDFRRISDSPFPSAVTVAQPGLDQNEFARVDVDHATLRLTQAHNGKSALSDRGLWKISADVLHYLKSSEPTEGESRMLFGIQRAIDAGLEIGTVLADEWLHLGGTEPTPQDNIAAVVAALVERIGSRT